MTYGGGKPHRVGYRGQEFKITVYDADKGRRVTLGWAPNESTEEALRALETRPSWTDARCERVENRETGE